MPNNVINKVVYGDRTLIDLTDTTADAADVASGKYFYAKDGVKTLGTGSIGGENGDVYQDAEGYIVLKPGAGTNVSVTPLSVTENGTYSAPTGVAYSPVAVDVGPAKSLSDITVSGSIVSGPAGLYSESFSKAVSAGSARIVGMTNNISPSLVFVSSTGTYGYDSSTATVTASINSVQFASGYFSSYTNIATGTITFNVGSIATTLPTLAATTYTPTETAQTINEYRWLTGSQTIAAISSSYVGTGIDRRSAADMYQSDTAVFAVSGYYSSEARFSLPTTSHLNPTLAFTSATGYIQATHDAYDAIMEHKMMMGGAYTQSSMTLPVFAATTWTPGTSNQTISRYQWLTGSQTILGDSNLIASNIKSGVSIFGVTGTVPDENDLPTIYATWDDNVGEYGDYVYSCNYTYNQMVSMLGDSSLVGEYHETWDDAGTTTVTRSGGTWRIDYNTNDPVFTIFNYSGNKYRYHSDGSIETISIAQSKEVMPSRYEQYIYPDYPHEYLYQVTVSGDNNLVPSNILSGVSIFGVQGTASSGDPYLPVYRSIANGSTVVSNGSMVTEWANSLIAVDKYQFAGVKFDGSITFGNVGYVDTYGFAFPFNNITYDTVYASLSFSKCSTINSNAFYRNANIVEVTAPSCLLISASAFANCTSLQKVSFGECLEISSNAFIQCWALSEVNIPKCSFIHQNAFRGCYNLKSISIPLCEDIGSTAFITCSKLSSVYAPNCVTLGSGAFAGPNLLEEISLPKVISIYSGTFSKCSVLRKVDFSECKSIYSRVFDSSCSSLSDLNFPKCENIGSYAFASCNAISEVEFPACLYVGEYAFASCIGLTSISFPMCEQIYNRTFWGCTSLKDVYIPKCVSLDLYVFSGCTTLSYIDAPNVSHIGPGTFDYCINLSQVIIGKNTTSINSCVILSSTFSRCYSLSNLYLLYPFVVQLSATNAFYSTPMLTSTSTGSIFVPASLYTSYKTTTNWIAFSSRFVSLTDAEISALTS